MDIGAVLPAVERTGLEADYLVSSGVEFNIRLILIFVLLPKSRARFWQVRKLKF